MPTTGNIIVITGDAKGHESGTRYYIAKSCEQVQFELPVLLCIQYGRRQLVQTAKVHVLGNHPGHLH
jgi:hypothetical protein